MADPFENLRSLGWQFDLTPGTAYQGDQEVATNPFSDPTQNIGGVYSAARDRGFAGDFYQMYGGGSDFDPNAIDYWGQAPGLKDWIDDQGWRWGENVTGGAVRGGYFTPEGEFLDQSGTSSKLGYDWGWLAPVAMFAGAGALGLGEAAGASAADLAAADAAGGLLPEYGTAGAYEAGLGAAPEVGYGGVPGATQGGLGAGPPNAAVEAAAQNLVNPVPANGSWDVLPPASSGGGNGALNSIGDWLGRLWDGDPKTLNQLRMITGGLGLASSLFKKDPPVSTAMPGINPLYNNWTPSQQAAFDKFSQPKQFEYKRYPRLVGNVSQLAHGGPVGGCGCGGALEYARGGSTPSGFVSHGAGGGQDDLVEARLSPGEYVMDADVVSALGDGNNAEGAKRLDGMREHIRRHKRSGSTKDIPPPAKSPLAYLKKGR